jgi:nitrate reductase cytochrome c-type subunit
LRATLRKSLEAQCHQLLKQEQAARSQAEAAYQDAEKYLRSDGSVVAAVYDRRYFVHFRKNRRS